MGRFNVDWLAGKICKGWRKIIMGGEIWMNLYVSLRLDIEADPAILLFFSAGDFRLSHGNKSSELIKHKVPFIWPE